MTDAVKDGILLFVASLALCAETLLLLQQMRVITLPMPWGIQYGSGLEIGYIGDTRNSVKSRNAHSLSWYAMVRGDRIHLHDSLLTGSDSYALVRLEAGDLLVEADTLVRFSRQQRKGEPMAVLSLEVGQGRVKVKSGAKVVRVKLRNRELALKPNSEVEVSRAPMAPHSDVKVKVGEVDLEDPEAIGSGAPVALKEGEALRDSPERGIARIETNLKLVPRWPSPGARIVAHAPMERIDFAWTGEEGQQLELDTGLDFSSPRTLPVKGRELHLELAPGHYFWRVRRDLAFSSPLEFTILPTVHYRLLTPDADGQVKAGVPVRLEWEQVPGATAYHVELSARPDFRESLLQSDLTSASTELEPLAPGEYYWRVRARHGSLGDWPVSSASSFSVKRKISAPRLKGGKVRAKKKSGAFFPPRTIRYASLALEWIARLLLPTADAAEETLELEVEWEAVKGAALYRLQIAESPRFNRVLKQVEVTRTFAVVEVPARQYYYWRVAAKDEDGEWSEFSATQQMRAPPPPAPPKPVAAVPRLPPKASPPRDPASNSSLASRLIPSLIGVGISDVFQSEQVNGASFDAALPGSYQRITLLAANRYARGEASLRLWEETIKYSPQGTTRQGVLKEKGFGAELLWRSHWPIAGGLRAATQPEIFRAGEDTLGLRSDPAFFLIVGPAYTWRFRPRAYLQGEVFFEGAPFGRVTGYGGKAALRVGYERLLGWLTPELEGCFQPSVLSFDHGATKQKTTAGWAALLFKIELDGSADGAAAKG